METPGSVEGFLGSRDGNIDVLLRSDGNMAQGSSRGRISKPSGGLISLKHRNIGGVLLDGLAIDRVDELVVDEEAGGESALFPEARSFITEVV